MRYSLFFLLVFSGNLLLSQIYFCDTRAQVGILDLEDCSVNYVRFNHLEPPIEFGGTLNDIALHPDGRLFGILGSQEGDLLVELNLSTGGVDTLGLIPESDCSSLVCSAEGVLYMGYYRLHSFDLATREFITYGAFPNFYRLIGDLILIDNALYGSLGGLPLSNGFIYQLDTSNSMQSPLVFTFPGDIWAGGLALKLDQECGSPQLIGSHSRLFDDVTDIYKLDITSGEVDSFCQVVLPLDDVIFGLTSSDEFRQNCQLRLDLDANNDSGPLIDHYFVDSFCVVDFLIGDEDLRITTNYALIDSVVISVEQGILEVGEEVLFAEPRPGLALQGVSTDRLVVVNQGGLSLEEMEYFLGTVRFQIQSENPESGERVVHTTLYADGTASDVAKSFIKVTIGQSPSAGEDVSVEVCYGHFRVDLFERLEGEPRAGGWWEPPLQGGDRFYAFEDTSGVYRYIVQEGGCGADTAEVEVLVHPPPAIGLGENGALLSIVDKCPEDTLFWDISLPGASTYWWRDGQEGPVATIVDPDIYVGLVIDANKCDWETRAVVRDYEPMVETEVINLCQGQSWSWEGGMIYQDTILCQPMEDVNGCAGLRCFDLRFAPPEQQWETLYFCQGEQPIVEGVSISRDTNFCLSPNGSGCGVQRCYIALFTPPVQAYHRVEICEGESLVFGDEIIENPGIYNQMLPAVDGCDSLAILELIVHPTYETVIDTIIPEGASLRVGEMSFATKGSYSISLPTVTGCDSLIQLTLDVQSTQYYAPGMVQAKGTGWGRVFTIYTKNDLPATIRKLEIYNTWGQRVFQLQDSPVGDESLAWKALYESGSPQAAAVYFYHAEMEDITGRKELVRGKFVVMY